MNRLQRLARLSRADGKRMPRAASYQQERGAIGICLLGEEEVCLPPQKMNE